MPDDPLWYQDAVFYQLHVKAYFDSNGDGIGDFAGLAARLDYIQDLGVDTLWLLPFYPSPMRDDGYDIADYRDVHPAYGTMTDFRAFVRAAHARGLKVVTELVINHTSDQHPWFQRARQARRGSPYRNYYVWADHDQGYAGTRIIFTDTERSNWAWDEVAGAYYWHRFFSHQPDLNFDNPRVEREVTSVMRHWLDTGVDGLRLDAVPYLCEREGTSNENLPETHAVLKRLRKAMDQSHPGRMFLAEANQWPEDVLPYFGDGDECQMAFHFPLMPRMYMAVAREDRHPITDIMRQTPDIPPNCQWAIFLRNHDELTLEMVSDRERDYLWNTYAADRRARVNLGIRRRLAPLMDNDRRRIELLVSLLLSMPGTPILYYGDEIGMGDNIYLGDRNGVRTPMQWSEDRNGGFSRADPARLYLPPIMDSVYGYQAVNVEAQARSPSSLLNWIRRLVEVRRARPTFGRGTLRFLYPANRKILAYLREYDGDTVLCVVNLARSAEGVELDLSEFKGRVPVELLGSSAFPPIGERPTFLSLPGHAFLWFTLMRGGESPHWHAPEIVCGPELITLVVQGGWDGVLSGRSRHQLEAEILPGFLRRQRWYGDKDSDIASVELLHRVELKGSERSWLLALLAVRRADGALRRYFLPLAHDWDRRRDDLLAQLGTATMARLRHGGRMGALYEAAIDDDFVLALLEAVRRGAVLAGGEDVIACHRTAALDAVELPPAPSVRRLQAEQSNTSLVVEDRLVVKLVRRPERGPSHEVEMGRWLTESVRFAAAPPLLGWIETADAGGGGAILAVIHGFVANQGDSWHWATAALKRLLDEGGMLAADEAAALLTESDMLPFARTLGRRVGELHATLALPTADLSFAPEPVGPADLEIWRLRARRQAEQALTCVAASDLPEAAALVARGPALLGLIDRLVPEAVTIAKGRIHGDLHLGQVLVAQNDVALIDFEGEPARTQVERRHKEAALRDVAGMVRSFDYAAAAVLAEIAATRPAETDRLTPLALRWRDGMVATFLEAWSAVTAGTSARPTGPDEFHRLLGLFLVEKACYEVCYEAATRPGWLAVPVRGVLGEMRTHGQSHQAD